MSDLSPLAKLATMDLSTVTISKSGDWMIFTTTDNEQIRLNCASLVLIGCDEYWNNYIGSDISDAVTYRLEQ